MSRIGRLPVKIPKGVKVQVQPGRLSYDGPKGKGVQEVSSDVTVAVEGESVVVGRTGDSREAKANHGLYRNLIKNALIGAGEGFSKTLIITGVGYKAEVKGKSLFLNLGYSTQIEYPMQEGFSIEVEANTRVTVRGSDKQRVGQVCAEIRAFRPTEPYKGKGIRYDSESVRRKVGKSGIK